VGEWRSFACLFSPCFFDCGDAGFWGFSVTSFGARGPAKRGFPAWEGCCFAGRTQRSCIAVPRLPLDARMSPQPSFDALYAPHERSVWALGPCPSSFVQHALRSALLHVELADVGDLAGILILLREGGGVALCLSHEKARHAFPLTGLIVFRARCIARAFPRRCPWLAGRTPNEWVDAYSDGRLTSHFTSRFIAIASIFPRTISTRAQYLHASPA
jgi:hypothetical protein